MTEGQTVKLCSCRCGCRDPVEDHAKPRCNYCDDWHDSPEDDEWFEDVERE